MKTIIILYFIGYFTYWLRHIISYAEERKGYYKYKRVFYKEVINKAIQGFFKSWFWFLHIINDIMDL